MRAPLLLTQAAGKEPFQNGTSSQTPQQIMSKGLWLQAILGIQTSWQNGTRSSFGVLQAPYKVTSKVAIHFKHLMGSFTGSTTRHRSKDTNNKFTADHPRGLASYRAPQGHHALVVVPRRPYDGHRQSRYAPLERPLTTSVPHALAPLSAPHLRKPLAVTRMGPMTRMFR